MKLRSHAEVFIAGEACDHANATVSQGAVSRIAVLEQEYVFHSVSIEVSASHFNELLSHAFWLFNLKKIVAHSFHYKSPIIHLRLVSRGLVRFSVDFSKLRKEGRWEKLQVQDADARICNKAS